MARFKDSFDIEYKDRAEFDTIREYYRNTFSTLEGQKVMRDILRRAGFDSIISNDEERVRHNFMKEILFMCGGHSTYIVGIHQ